MSKNQTTDTRNCTCHPREAPNPCQHKYALSECLTAAAQTTQELVDLISLAIQEVDDQHRAYAAQKALNELVSYTYRLEGMIQEKNAKLIRVREAISYD